MKSSVSKPTLLLLMLIPFTTAAAETRTLKIPIVLRGSVKAAAGAKSRLDASYSGRSGADSIKGRELGTGPVGRVFGVFRVVSEASVYTGGSITRDVFRKRVSLSRRGLGTPYGTVRLRRPLDPKGARQWFRGRAVLKVSVDVVGNNGAEPWVSDGTDAGTRLLKDIHPDGDSNPRGFVEMGGKVYFSADDGIHGRELWVSDGTTPGTLLLKDIQPGSTGSNPDNLAAADGVLYFSANDGSEGEELWRSDGTAGGTYRLKDLLAGSESSRPRTFREVNSGLIFWAYDGNRWNLWRTDGTAEGTVFLYPLKLPADAEHMFLLGNEWIFTVWTESTHEFWKTDGTALGTKLIMGGNFYAKNFVRMSAGVFFTRWNVGNSELWTIDETGTGITFVRSFSNANLWSMAAMNDRLYFGLDDGSDDSQDLWTSDGTSGGTRQLSAVVDGFSQIQDLLSLGGELLFRVNDSTNQYELWQSNGGTDGTGLLIDIGAAGYSADVDELTLAGGRVFFSAKDADGDRELWVTDGTAAGTRKVGTIIPGPGNPDVRRITRFGTGVVFSANNSGAQPMGG